MSRPPKSHTVGRLPLELKPARRKAKSMRLVSGRYSRKSQGDVLRQRAADRGSRRQRLVLLEIRRVAAAEHESVAGPRAPFLVLDRVGHKPQRPDEVVALDVGLNEATLAGPGNQIREVHAARDVSELPLEAEVARKRIGPVEGAAGVTRGLTDAFGLESASLLHELDVVGPVVEDLDALLEAVLQVPVLEVELREGRLRTDDAR